MLTSEELDAIASTNTNYFANMATNSIYVGPGEVKVLQNPKKETHKNQNGRLFIYAGDKGFDTSALLAAKVACKFAGSVYYYSTKQNNKLFLELSKDTYEFVMVSDDELEKYIEYSDAYLFGSWISNNFLNRSLINSIFDKSGDKPKIIEANVIQMIENRKLAHCILEVNRTELLSLFPQDQVVQQNVKGGGGAFEGRLKRYAKEKECFINLKGHVSMLFGPSGEFKMNKTGNVGMAKVGSGDVLAGITATFATKNDLWLSMCAGSFVNGAAGDLCYKDVGYSYSASDLIVKVQQVVMWAKDFS